MSYESWVRTIERDAQRYSVLFLHLGCAFRPLLGHLEGLSTHLTVEQFLLSDVEIRDDVGLLVLVDVESCTRSRRLTLASLRAAIMDRVDRGSRFVLISSVSRSSYPDGVGSDLLADAKHVFAPLPDLETLSPADLPGWTTVAASKEMFLGACIGELGADTVVGLSERIWDAGLSPNETLDSLSHVDKESLRGAGLVTVDGDAWRWSFPKDWKAVRQGVAIASSRYLTVTDWLRQVFLDLWLIERHIRNVFRDALMDAHGASWREACASQEFADELVGRARRDVQPTAERIGDLRDPLEWMTTSELLELRMLRELGALGLESYLWTKLREDVLPIRNRGAHMRIVSERDARTVGTWRKLVVAKVHFPPSGISTASCGP